MKIGASASIAFMDHDELKRAVESGQIEAVVSHTGNHKRFGAIAILKEPSEQSKRVSKAMKKWWAWRKEVAKRKARRGKR